MIFSSSLLCVDELSTPDPEAGKRKVPHDNNLYKDVCSNDYTHGKRRVPFYLGLACFVHLLMSPCTLMFI